MTELRRRSFLQPAFAGLSTALLAQVPNVATTRKAVRVLAGTDREREKRAVVSSTTYKVVTQETGSDLFVIEQLNHTKDGSPCHLHHPQDELLYTLEGEYILEVDGERFHLKAGDCVLGPRGIAHACAFIGDTTGKLLTSFTPAKKMEAFFNEREKLGIKPGRYATTSAYAAMMHDFEMELVGPPLALNGSPASGTKH